MSERIASPVAGATNPLEGAASLLTTGQDRRLAGRLFALLAAGERLAEHVAGIEARLAPNAREARFFRAQARHERLHALTFHRVQRVLLPSSPAADAVYEPFRRRVDAAAQAGLYLECVLATQVILENVGERLLGELDAALTCRGVGFQRLRRLFIEQEAAHHAFGRALIRDALSKGYWSGAALLSKAEPYLAEVASWLTGEAAMADSFTFDRRSVVSAVAGELGELAATPTS